MTSTTTTATETFNAMENNEEWGGWGYLGERRHYLQTEGHNHQRAAVARADQAAYTAAAERGLSPEALFDWANSKTGRWYADCALSGDFATAARYLPGTDLNNHLTRR